MKGKVVFENGKLVLNGPFPEYNEVTQHFMRPIRPVIESIRAFPLRYLYPARGNAAFQTLLKRTGRGSAFDHSKDEVFDARFVFRGIVDTGCRLVYSFESRKTDLGQWLSNLWNPQVLTNPATSIGKSTVRYAKDFSRQPHQLRFVPQNGFAYENPHVLIYAPRERIIELFRLATKYANFTRHFRRGIVQTYGRRSQS